MYVNEVLVDYDHIDYGQIRSTPVETRGAGFPPTRASDVSSADLRLVSVVSTVVQSSLVVV
jgi:hypothetical protein